MVQLSSSTPEDGKLRSRRTHENLLSRRIANNLSRVVEEDNWYQDLERSYENERKLRAQERLAAQKASTTPMATDTDGPMEVHNNEAHPTIEGPEAHQPDEHHQNMPMNGSM
jgi:hypothetical protein